MLVGSIVMFAGNSAPQGWLLCDGSAIPRNTYSHLFDVIGTMYGEGDGNTTFNIPNLSGRVLIGYSEEHPLSSIGGEESHTIVENELPQHSHSVGQHGHANGITISTPILQHTITQASFTYTAPNATKRVYDGSSMGYSGTTSTTATLSTSVAISEHASSDCTVTGSISDCNAFDTENTGNNIAHDNMQPFITLNYIIYVG